MSLGGKVRFSSSAQGMKGCGQARALKSPSEEFGLCSEDFGEAAEGLKQAGGPCSSCFIASLSPAFPADSLCFMHRLREDCRVDMRPRHLSLTPLLVQEKPLGGWPSTIQFIILFSFLSGLGEEREVGQELWLWCGSTPKSASGTAL